MINVYINDIEVQVQTNTTILQACEKIDIYIPRFCYHDQLSIAGNCRMCLVEVEKSPKPVVSCAFPVMANMKIYTNSPLVKKARENVLEFLLLNHPLDCPICDQGGECDLQDQTLLYGSDKSRFYDYKRAVEDKNCGPLIKTIMTRCIHCTRCVRFIDEMTSFKNLGTVNRGNKVEIGTYFERIINTEFSGNIIDLCPVGALTSKPYAFNTRPWELKSQNNIDIMDAVGSNIRVDFKDLKILRILPRINKTINDEWISDKTRFFYDGLKYQRLTQPLIINNDKFNTIRKLSWFESFKILNEIFKYHITTPKKKTIGFILGDLIDLETAASIKYFANKFGIINILNLNTKNQNTDFLSTCNFNENLSTIKLNDICLIIGSNIRNEAAIYNLKLLNQVKNKNLKVYYIGPKIDLTYNYIHLGSNLNTLINIIEGKHKFCQTLKKAKNPLLIYGNDILNRKDFDSFIFKNFLKYLKFNIKDIKILNHDVSNLSLLNLNIKPKKNSLFLLNLKKNKPIHTGIDILYLVGVQSLPDNYDLTNTTLIYQGSHISKIAEKANIILPTQTIFEKDALYCNIEGRVQQSSKVINLSTNFKNSKNLINNKKNIFIPKTDISIFTTLLKKNLNIILKPKKLLFWYSPNLTFINKISKTLFSKYLIEKNEFKYKIILNSNIKLKINNFYKTNMITNSSILMAKCSNLIKKNINFKN
jgi:NADH-quinone oxidoreductase chain G